jgi:NAD(P)-dependent dehydrogenase (short-subunit alcohol dehydrogenase family)
MASAADLNFDAGLRGRRVLATAGAAGIGLAIVERLLRCGARVFVCDVADAALEALAKAHPQARAVRADVSREADVERMFVAIGAEFGGLDALVNNAGIAGPTSAVEDIDPAEWRRCLDVCLTGQFLCARSAVPMLKAAGGGSIINMSSAAGRQSLAKELGPANIRVNAILPGVIEGPRMENVIRDRARQLGVSRQAMEKTYLERISLRRMTSPHDVAAMVAFLISDAGVNISGQSIGVDGNVESL